MRNFAKNYLFTINLESVALFPVDQYSAERYEVWQEDHVMEYAT